MDSNAWALEWATSENPRAGSLITFAQYLIVTVFGLKGRFTTQPPRQRVKQQDSATTPSRTSVFERIRHLRLKPLAVPVSRWIIQVLLFLGVSLLNNAAFGYRVPMAVHIVFRSGGLVVNMILGYLTQGRRYSTQQVIAVILVSVGIAAATTSGSNRQRPASTAASSSIAEATIAEYSIGILMLTVALVLSTFLGFAQEKAYGKYGRHWEEGMFFLHFLALPMFAFLGSDLKAQIRSANASPRVSLVQSFYTPSGLASSPVAPGGPITFPLPIIPIPKLGVLPSSIPSFIQKRIDRFFIPLVSDFSVPSFWIPLTINIATQLVCVSGVNRLTARVSSLSVVLVLALRKAVSLIISVVFIGRSTGNAQLWAGSIGVLVGTVLYSLAPKPRKEPSKED